MPLVIDMSQIIVATVARSSHFQTGIDLSTSEAIENIILRTVRNIINKNRDYGEVIVAFDSKDSWRKDIFPFYKTKRSEQKAATAIDWNVVDRTMKDIRVCFKHFFPFKTVYVRGAEADDVIGTIVHEWNKLGPIRIISGDKDFKQLHTPTDFPGIVSKVTQYSPIKDEEITCSDPVTFLASHVLRGDMIDSVPNMTSPDNIYTISQRQKPITAKLEEEFLSYWTDNGLNEQFFEDYDNDKIWKSIKKHSIHSSSLHSQYIRNRSMIDLRMIPSGIKEDILHKLEEPAIGTFETLCKFLNHRRHTHLLRDATDFFVKR